MIVHEKVPVTLIGGGIVHDLDIKDAVSLAPICVAADGGADVALASGVELAAVIGDFDSISPETQATLPQHLQHRIVEQESTDFDKALRNIDAPLVLAIGFSGGRFDHQLAVLSVLAAYPDRSCILVGQTELTLLCPPVLDLSLDPGSVVSLFPLGPVQGTSTGLEWPIDGLHFDPLGRIGTSNRATGPVHLEVDAPHMICFLPREVLPNLMQALAQAPRSARWPARAGRYKDQHQS